MLWVTRPKCHIDRTASAWLIRRFVDPSAEFAFAADKEAAESMKGIPFDMRGVELGHHEGRCSFESILLKYRIDDPGLTRMGELVHEIDVDDDRFHTPEAAGLDAVIRGLGQVTKDDRELFTITDRIFDGLLERLRQAAG